MGRRAGRRRRCRFPGKSATASGCSARSATSCFIPTARGTGSILASEQALELQSDGRGWARNTVNRLCIDLAGRISEPCTRDNVKENYLTPVDHPVTVRLTGAGSGRRHLRLVVRRWRRPAAIDAGLRRADQLAGALRPPHRRDRGRLQRIRGAAAPDHRRSRCATSSSPGSATASHRAKAIRTAPIALADEGFCFRSYLGTAGSAVLPPEPRRLQGRPRLRGAGFAAGLAAPERALVQFGLPPLALQLPDPHRAGARGALPAHRGDLSAAGLHRRHHRRRPVRSATRPRMPAGEIGSTCQGTVNAQLAELRDALTAAKRRQPDRKLDLVLLSIGANDINFSGLVADIIVDAPTERELFKRIGVIGSVDDSRAALARDLPRGFRQAARGAEAAGRRPLACRLRLLCQSDAGRRRALPRRPRRLRYSSLVQRRSAAARQRLGLRAERIPAAAQGARAVPVAACCAAIPRPTA